MRRSISQLFSMQHQALCFAFRRALPTRTPSLLRSCRRIVTRPAHCPLRWIADQPRLPRFMEVIVSLVQGSRPLMLRHPLYSQTSRRRRSHPRLPASGRHGVWLRGTLISRRVATHAQCRRLRVTRQSAFATSLAGGRSAGQAVRLISLTDAARSPAWALRTTSPRRARLLVRLLVSCCAGSFQRTCR